MIHPQGWIATVRRAAMAHWPKGQPPVTFPLKIILVYYHDETTMHLDDDILTRDTVALTLSQGSQDGAAVLLAWSAVAAALRVFALRERVSLESDQPLDVVVALYSRGLLYRDGYKVLRRGLRAFTMVAQGFRLPPAERHLAADLVSKARELLHTGVSNVAAH